MSDDQTFRIVLLVAFVILVPFAPLYHRLKNRSLRARTGPLAGGAVHFVALRPIGIAGMLGLIAFVDRPWLMSWSAVPLSELASPVRQSGVGVVARRASWI